MAGSSHTCHTYSCSGGSSQQDGSCCQGADRAAGGRGNVPCGSHRCCPNKKLFLDQHKPHKPKTALGLVPVFVLLTNRYNTPAQALRGGQGRVMATPAQASVAGWLPLKPSKNHRPSRDNASLTAQLPCASSDICCGLLRLTSLAAADCSRKCTLHVQAGTTTDNQPVSLARCRQHDSTS